MTFLLTFLSLYIFTIWIYIIIVFVFCSINWYCRDRCGRDRMVVGFTTTYVISAYHHECCELESHSGEVYSIQHYVFKFVSNLQQSVVSTSNKTDHHDITEILMKVALNNITLIHKRQSWRQNKILQLILNIEIPMVLTKWRQHDVKTCTTKMIFKKRVILIQYTPIHA